MSAPVDAVVHTPGPWTHCEQRGTPGHCFTAQVFDADGQSLAVVETTNDERLATANARLIAAAPELLDACKILLMLSLPTDISGERMVERARAAVAKAEGRSVV